MFAESWQKEEFFAHQIEILYDSIPDVRTFIIVLGQMWFPIQTLAQIFSDIMLDKLYTNKNWCIFFTCSKHWCTFFNVNQCLLEQRLAIANIGTH